MTDRREAPPPCPICGKPSRPATQPFCSPRCGQVDLGRWFGEQYRVPTEEPPAPAPGPDEEPSRMG